MITSDILKLLGRRVPNYHLLSQRFIRGSVSTCPCAACRHCIRRHGTSATGFSTYFCGLVLRDFTEMKCAGHAVVAGNGTCDAAEFVQEKYDNFTLEGESRTTPETDRKETENVQVQSQEA